MKPTDSCATLRERLLKAYSERADNYVAVIDAPDLYEVIGILQELSQSAGVNSSRPVDAEKSTCAGGAVSDETGIKGGLAGPAEREPAASQSASVFTPSDEQLQHLYDAFMLKVFYRAPADDLETLYARYREAWERVFPPDSRSPSE